MKYGFVGDVHGSDLRKIEAEFKARKVDHGICLGDFDRVYTARQMMEMQIEGIIPWSVVPGNHDYAHLTRDPIYSGTMDKQGITSEMMWKEWELPENRIVRAYVQRMIDNKSNIKNAVRRLSLNLNNDPDWKAIVMHGAYAGDDSQGEPTDLWTRLKTNTDHEKNFKVMEEKSYRIMIRGHDHKPDYTYQDPKDGVKTHVPEGKFSLSKNRRYTINPGAYFKGNFAIIDTEGLGNGNPTVEFHTV